MNDVGRRHKKLRTLIYENRKVKVQFCKLLCKRVIICVLSVNVMFIALWT